MTQQLINGTGDETTSDFVCDGSVIHILVEGGTTYIDPIKVTPPANLRLRFVRSGDFIYTEWRYSLAFYRRYQDPALTFAFPNAEQCILTVQE